jgi:hypothetical protein
MYPRGFWKKKIKDTGLKLFLRPLRGQLTNTHGNIYPIKEI